MEYLTKFKHIKMHVIMIEYMHKVMMVKDGKHGLDYGFQLNRMVAYFNMKCGPRKDGPIKKMFTLSTLEENKCISRQNKVKSKSVVADLIEVQTRLTGESEKMTTYLV